MMNSGAGDTYTSPTPRPLSIELVAKTVLSAYGAPPQLIPVTIRLRIESGQAKRLATLAKSG